MILERLCDFIMVRKKGYCLPKHAGFCALCGCNVDELERNMLCQSCSRKLYGFNGSEEYFEDPHYGERGVF